MKKGKSPDSFKFMQKKEPLKSSDKVLPMSKQPPSVRPVSMKTRGPIKPLRGK